VYLGLQSASCAIIWITAVGPDKQEKGTQTVLEQAEVLSAAWAV